MNALKFYESSINMGGGVMLPVRSTQLMLSDGSSLLFSPIRFNNDQLNELRALPPTAIIAPNCFHHLFVKPAADEFKSALLFAAPGLSKKRPDIAWSKTLEVESWPFAKDVEMIAIQGAPAFNECVFFHKASKTLIVADLFFNLKDLPTGFKTFIYRIVGTYNRPAVSRLLRFLTRNKAAIKKSLQEVLALDFENLVMSHGEIIRAEAKSLLREALQTRGLLS